MPPELLAQMQEQSRLLQLKSGPLPAPLFAPGEGQPPHLAARAPGFG